MLIYVKLMFFNILQNIHELNWTIYVNRGPLEKRNFYYSLFLGNNFKHETKPSTFMDQHSDYPLTLRSLLSQGEFSLLYFY